MSQFYTYKMYKYISYIQNTLRQCQPLKNMYEYILHRLLAAFTNADSDTVIIILVQREIVLFQFFFCDAFQLLVST